LKHQRSEPKIIHAERWVVSLKPWIIGAGEKYMIWRYSTDIPRSLSIVQQRVL
jgi:hypothetical protein